MGKMLLASLLVAMTWPASAVSQGACPPDDAKPRRLVERIALDSVYQRALDIAGMDHLDVDEIRVLSPETDSAVCRLLNVRLQRYQDEVRHPGTRWTFYEAQGRYFVIYWIPRPPPGQPPRISFNRVEIAWILDKDLKVLVKFGI